MEADVRQTIRVLAADDSAVMRSFLRALFRVHASENNQLLPRIELCGVVNDGEEALLAITSLQPDLLLLDLEMPRLNGLGVLERLREAGSSLPVIMCSAYTAEGARSTLDALSRGANDYVLKPGQQANFASAIDLLLQQLLPKIIELGASRRRKTSYAEAGYGVLRSASLGLAGALRTGAPQVAINQVKVIVIGISTGGPSALELMLPMLPPDFNVPVLIVQHMPKLFTNALAERLNRSCSLQVAQARDGAAIEGGAILLAPGDAHMEIAPGQLSGRYVVKLHHRPPLNSCTPSVDYLFQSAARWCGAGTLAVVMTGMGSDGLDGSRAIHNAGGTVIAQDQETSAIWGMPRRIVEEGVASATLPLSSLAGALVSRVQRGRSSMACAAQEVMHGVL